MNIFLYIIIFTMGTVFGSFYTLAVYRIPRKLDITHTHSFCPNCNHKLGFFELIPVWSYIFLGGKCKECKQKIRPRYLILEILSGFTFVCIALCEKITIENLAIPMLIETGFLCLYLVAIFIIAGIDKERIDIQNGVIYYVLVVMFLYMIYLYIIEKASIYRYVMYLCIEVVLLIVNINISKKSEKKAYITKILMLLIVMATFTGEWTVVLTIIMTFLELIIHKILTLICKSKEKMKIQNVSMGFYLCISNVISLIFMMYVASKMINCI